MDFNQAVQLLQGAGPFKNSGRWVDLGCGEGLFTEALASLLPSGSTLYAVDTQKNLHKNIPGHEQVRIIPRQLDFIKDKWPFSNLDGVMMANSFHYVKDKASFVREVCNYLISSHQFIMIEYDTTRSNPWIPYPIDFPGLRSLFTGLGYEHIEKMGKVPSVYGVRTIYSAKIW